MGDRFNLDSNEAFQHHKDSVGMFSFLDQQCACNCLLLVALLFSFTFRRRKTTIVAGSTTAS